MSLAQENYKSYSKWLLERFMLRVELGEITPRQAELSFYNDKMREHLFNVSVEEQMMSTSPPVIYLSKF